MINWPIVLIGNLIMDSAIAIFAILLGMESYYRKIADEIVRGFDDFFPTTNREIEIREHDIVNLLKEQHPSDSDFFKIIKSAVQTHFEQDVDDEETYKWLYRYVTKFTDKYKAKKLIARPRIKKAEKYSPFVGAKFIIISTMFIIGIFIQIIGIFFGNLFLF